MNLTAPRDGKLQDDATKDLVYDFASIDKELDDDASLWESYQHQCFSQDPPVPALSLMQPILNGDKNEMKEKISIVGMSSQMIRGDMHWRFNVEITRAESLKKTLKTIQDLPGVYNARRT